MYQRKTIVWMAALLAVFLVGTFAAVLAQPDSSQQSADDLYQSALLKKEAEGDLSGAIRLFQEVVTKFPGKRDIAAKAQLQIGICYEKLGTKEAEKAFQKVIDNYPEQSEAVREANEKLSALLRARRTAESGDEGLRLRKVGSLDVLGAPSPDGRLISCVDWETGDLALFELASGKMRRVTNKGSWKNSSDFAEESIFAPDGKSITFNWYNSENNRYDLRTIGVDGTKQRILYSDDRVDYIWPCSWTPDGRGIVSILTGAGKNQSNRIALISASDGSAQTVKEFTSGVPGQLSLSPDGQWIAYDYPYEVPWRKGTEKCDILLLSIDGSREVPFVTHPADDRLLGWSPDGKSIFFSSDRSGAWDAWIQPVEDGVAVDNLRLVKRDFGDPKTRPMGFTRDSSFFYGLRTSQFDVYVVSLDPSTGGPSGRAQKAALRFEGSNGYPCWSADGSRLAYTSFRRQDQLKPAVLCINSMISGETREFFPENKDFVSLSWFPDGNSILCRGRVEPRRLGLFRVDLVKGGTERFLILDDDAGGLHGPVLSRDGKRIIYDLDDFENKTFRVMSYDLETKQKKELISGPSQIISYDLSPDGKKLAFKEEDEDGDCLKVIPSEGGEKKTLLILDEGEGINSIAWSPDDRFIYFSKWEKGSSKSEACSIWRIGAEGGSPQKYDLTMEGLSSLSIHPDGEKLAFNSWRVEGEVWVMENFLPQKK